MAKKLRCYRVAIGRPVTIEVMATSAKDAERRAINTGEGEEVYEDDGFVLIGRARRHEEGDPDGEES